MRILILILACLSFTITSQAEIITVDSNGPADFNNIQDAINYSWHGDTVIVKPGTYSENVYFNSRAVTLTSENPDDSNVVKSTIITADFGYSITFDFGESSDSVLTGFTITGQGIYCYASSPTISKNIITDCDGQGLNGELNAAPVISYNIITSNSYIGIRRCNGPITGNTISGHMYWGIDWCSGDISYNTISNNQLAGIYNCDGIISNNTISKNSGFGVQYCDGTIVFNKITGNQKTGLNVCTGVIANNIIAGNKAQTLSGGGLSRCSGPIYNNVIVSNIAETGGGLFVCSGWVRNNIIAFNRSYTGGGFFGAADNAFNNLWLNEGGNFAGGATAGYGDFADDPLFAANGYWDPNGTVADTSDDFWVDGDYHLQSEAGRWDPNSQTWIIDTATSRCIDAGDPDSDWSGELWPHGRRINLGVYGGTPQASMSLLDLGNIADLDNNGAVNLADYSIFGTKWQAKDSLLPQDLDRDGLIGTEDLLTFCNNWLWEE